MDGFEAAARSALEEAHDARLVGERDEHERVANLLERLDVARREALPPSTRLERLLHPWVGFGVMPLFALANAGVRFRASDSG